MYWKKGFSQTRVQVCSQTGYSCNVWNLLSVEVKIHFRAIFNIPNRQRYECTLSMITIRWSESQRQYVGSVRKPGAGTRLRICKDSCRCQGHYLHGYRILQHQVQIKFLEAPLASLVFPRIQGLWQQKPWVNNNTGELAAAVASALSRLAFFIICCWPATKLHWSASFGTFHFHTIYTPCVTLNVKPLSSIVQFDLVQFSVSCFYGVGKSCECEAELRCLGVACHSRKAVWKREKEIQTEARTNLSQTPSKCLSAVLSSTPLNLFNFSNCCVSPYSSFPH